MIDWVISLNTWCSKVFGAYWSMENPITFLIVGTGTWKLVHFKALWTWISKTIKLPWDFVRYKVYNFWYTFIAGAALWGLADIVVDKYVNILSPGVVPTYTMYWDTIKIELWVDRARITLPVNKWTAQNVKILLSKVFLVKILSPMFYIKLYKANIYLNSTIIEQTAPNNLQSIVIEFYRKDRYVSRDLRRLSKRLRTKGYNCTSL